MNRRSCTEREFKGELEASAVRHEKRYADSLLNCRPSEATAEVLMAWVQGVSLWPLAKIRRHQRINYSYPKRTADLDVMVDVYRRAVELKCFKPGKEWQDTGKPFMARPAKRAALGGAE